MADDWTQASGRIAICIAVTCLCGCTSLHPLEPGGAAYPPPGEHFRYDMVPGNSHTIRVPVTGLRGDPSRVRITLRDEYNPAVVFDSEVTPTIQEDYLLYELDKSTLSNRCAEAGIENPAAQVTVEVRDERDPDEGFFMRWLRWRGRSAYADYFIAR